MREGEAAMRQQQEADGAERSVLGSMLRLNRCIHDVERIVSEDDYAADAHRRLHRAILAIHGSDGKAVDLVILAERLGRTGELADVGGPTALAALWDAAPTAANAEHYARIVHERGTLRRLRSAGAAIVGLADLPRGDAGGAVAEAERLLYAVAQRQHGEARKLDGVLDEWEDAYRHREGQGAMAGVEPGVPALAALVPAFLPGQLIVVGARPGVGKTSIALAIMRAAAEAGTGVFLASLEMTRGEIAERLIAAEARVDGQRLTQGAVPLHEMDRVLDACRVLRALPCWIDDASSQTARRIAGTARRLVARRGVGLVVVDYVALMGADKGLDRREQVGGNGREMKALAKDLGVPVVLLSQINRESTHRADGKPRLSDLSESDTLGQDADKALLLHRPDPLTERLDIIVAKQRNGPTGEVSVRFVASQLRFAEWHDSPFGGRAA